MRRIADLHAGEAKTDARDAVIIAEAARTLPHALRTLKLTDEQIAEPSMLCGFDDDLAAQTTQASNRIRGLLTQINSSNVRCSCRPSRCSAIRSPGLSTHAQ
ncbi:ISSfl2 ORF [Erwinia tracheiphila PSU-1]|nr:ISSfl2 ORF [Erwinia tracheiphila PSU-1]